MWGKIKGILIQDADGSPIIVISENPLASPSKEEIPDLDEELDQCSSPTKSKFISETLEQGLDGAKNSGVNLR